MGRRYDEIVFKTFLGVGGFLAMFFFLLPSTTVRYWKVFLVVFGLFSIPAAWYHSWTPFLWPVAVVVYGVFLVGTVIWFLFHFPDG